MSPTDLDALMKALQQMGYREVLVPKMGPEYVQGRDFCVQDEAGELLLDGKTHKYQFLVALGSGFGYAGFYVKFFFDANGKSIGHGCWE